MTLVELCEPLLQYIARLGRLARIGRAVEMMQVRSDINRLLAEMRNKAASTGELIEQYDKIELPLIFFIDFMVKESQLSFSDDWIEIGRERNELAGDEKFFDLLDETLADPTEAATQRLVVFYTCLGLGFSGMYAGQPQSVQKFMSRITARISSMMDADEKTLLCAEAYENVDSRDFVEPTGGKLVGIGMALVGALVVFSVAYIYYFVSASSGVDKALKTISGYQATSSLTGELSQENDN